MLVQRVAPSGSRVESWTVLGDVPVEPVEGYLAYLAAVERSPNTAKAYPHDLKDFFVFLALRSLDWREVRLEVGRGHRRGLCQDRDAGGPVPAQPGSWLGCQPQRY